MSDIDLPLPIRTELTAPYWDSLQQGQLSFQKCRRCGHAWLPARTECPSCLHDDWHWVPASGRAKVATRIRLARTQRVVALAEWSDGRVLEAINEVKVTIGGCGG